MTDFGADLLFYDVNIFTEFNQIVFLYVFWNFEIL